MLFAALLKAHPGTVQERAARRVEWQHPEEIQVVAEYWLQTSHPQVIAIFEADHVGEIMGMTAAWTDVFDITVVPAVTAEEGLQLVQET